MSIYNGTIDLISGLRPKNNGTFPLVSAKDVQVDDTGKRLDTRLSELAEGASNSFEIASFDLAALGLGTITTDGDVVSLTDVDLSALMSALATGTVQVAYSLTVAGEAQKVTSVLHAHKAGNSYLCTIPLYENRSLDFVTFIFTATSVSAYAFSLGHFNEITRSIPTFDLVSLGLPVILPDGNYVGLQTDTTEIINALKKGAVNFILKSNTGTETTFNCVMTAIYEESGGCSCSYMGDIGGAAMLLSIGVGTAGLSAKITPLNTYIGAYIDTALGGDY